MDKDGFLGLIYEVCREMPDLEVRRQFLDNKFAKEGYTKEIGYRQTSFFYRELEKFKDGEPSVYVGRMIVNNEEGTFGMVADATCKIKIHFTKFESLRELFCPLCEPQQMVQGEELMLFRKVANGDAEVLFNDLKRNGYISSSANREVFIGLFANGIMPSESQKIVWIKNKQSLREMLKALKSKDGTMADIERSVPNIFLYQKSIGKKPEPMRLAKNRLKDTDTDSHILIDILNKLATI